MEFFLGRDKEIDPSRGERPGVNWPVEPIIARLKPLGYLSEAINRKKCAMAALFFACVVIGCGSSPEVTSEEGQKCLDAIYTAVTSKKPELLDQCSSQIKTLETEGHLPSDSANFLREIIGKASAGEWQTAATELDAYIREQNPR